MKKTGFFLTLIAASFLCGCATSHPDDYSALKAASALPQPGNNQALVYVYSHDLPLFHNFDVWANSNLVCSTMAYGKFFYFNAAPGDVHLASEIHARYIYGAVYGGLYMKQRERVAFNVVAGETYYVNMHNGFARETMDLDTKERGGRKIQDCRWTGALPAN